MYEKYEMGHMAVVFLYHNLVITWTISMLKLIMFSVLWDIFHNVVNVKTFITILLM